MEKKTIIVADQELPFSKVIRIRLLRNYLIKVVPSLTLALPQIQRKDCCMTLLQFPYNKPADYYKKFIEGIKLANPEGIIFLLYGAKDKSQLAMFNGLRIDGLVEKPIPDDKMENLVVTYLEGNG
jgi:hypothetical protein